MHCWTTGSPPRCHKILQDRSPYWFPPNPYTPWRYPQDSFLNLLWTLQIPGPTFWSHQCTSNLHGPHAYSFASTPGRMCHCIPWWHPDLLKGFFWTLTTPQTSTPVTLQKPALWQALKVWLLPTSSKLLRPYHISWWHHCRTSQDRGYIILANTNLTPECAIIPWPCEFLPTIHSQLFYHSIHSHRPLEEG